MVLAEAEVTAGVIILRHSEIVWTEQGCVTWFSDRTSYGAIAHHTPDYREVASRCGCADDLRRYARRHDFCHSFLSERLFGCPSPILWALAHGAQPDREQALGEEATVSAFQRYLSDESERPIINDAADSVDWRALRSDALALLHEADR